MADPALQTFAVFANSNQAVVKTTEKSVCSIPFQSNLAVHDPHKLFKIALSMVKYTNSVYNITFENNTLEIAVEFAPGRGFLEGDTAVDRFHRWQTWQVRIPPGAYDIIELSNLLSEGRYTYNPETQNAYYNRAGYEVTLQPFTYANEPANVPLNAPGNGGQNTSPVNIFNGFGAVPADASDPVITKAALSIDNNSKLVFQSPDIGHLTQFGVDITTPCINRLQPVAPGNVPDETTLDYSFIYKGVYLLFNSNTAPMLKLLGFFNIDSVPAPEIAGYINNQNQFQSVSGYGLTFTASTAYDQYPVYVNGVLAVPQPDFLDPTKDYRYAKDNITKYALRAYLLGGNGVETFLPTLPLEIIFSGHFTGNTNTAIVGDPTPFLNSLYVPNAGNTDYIVASPGYTVQGVNILPPYPQILQNQTIKLGYTYQRIICSRDKADPQNFRWNYNAANLAFSLLPTEIGIWGADNTSPVPPNNGAPPLGIQDGIPITFCGNGLGDANVYLNNAGAPNAVTTNLFGAIMQSGVWRLVDSGPLGGLGTDRTDWIYCITITQAPQSTVAVPLPARMITGFAAGVDGAGNIDDTQWLRPEAGGPAITDYMGYYNLMFQTNRITVNNPQLIATVSPTIAYTQMLATNVGLNNLTSFLIPKNLTNLEGLDEIHVHCAQLRTKHLASTSFQALAPSDVIAVVPVDVPFGSKGTWQPPVPLESYVANTNIVNLDFRLTDSANRLLDFNGLDWSMVFNCTEVDVVQPQNMGGTINTPFQDQLATMEGTAQAQTRAMRKRGGMLPHEFYEENTDMKRKNTNSYSNRY
jgi:hypothetical protein